MPKASVKIMLSYDYNHFEICLGEDREMNLKEVNELRKDAQRLADEAVKQYKVAKEQASKNLSYDKERFLSKIEKIKNISENLRTYEDKAMLKLYEDTEWQKQFEPYDYDDDF
jgi:hypothetical protein